MRENVRKKKGSNKKCERASRDETKMGRMVTPRNIYAAVIRISKFPIRSQRFEFLKPVFCERVILLYLVRRDFVAPKIVVNTQRTDVWDLRKRILT